MDCFRQTRSQTIIRRLKRLNMGSLLMSYSRYLRLGEVQKVWQTILLKEKIPINDLVTILETSQDYGNNNQEAEFAKQKTRAANH